MGRTCNTCGGELKCICTGFWWGNLRKRSHFEDPGVDGGGAVLRWILRKWDGGMEWIGLAQDRDRWWVLVNAVVILQVPINPGNS